MSLSWSMTTISRSFLVSVPFSTASRRFEAAQDSSVAEGTSQEHGTDAGLLQIVAARAEEIMVKRGAAMLPNNWAETLLMDVVMGP